MRVCPRPTFAPRLVLTASVVLLALAIPARAQDPPPHLAHVDGGVSLAREDELLDAEPGQPLVPGDRLRTGAGRAEVWFPDGSALALDSHTAVEWRSAETILLTEGRVALTISRLDGRERPERAAAPYRIETPAGSAVTSEPGDYRVSLMSDRAQELVELVVVRGRADLLGDGGAMSVRDGERSFSRLGSAPSYPQVSMASRVDAFERWVLARKDGRLRRSTAARHLPDGLEMYGGTFEQYGTWEQEPAYGAVWYPRVDVGWRPYFNGYWTPVRRYGWTWIGTDAWGWPTHHYGRWGYLRSRWFWIPDRHWGPAWVSWAGSPGYVSWCPLGFDNRPVFALSVGTGLAWNAWVVLPRPSFGRRHFVHRYAIDGRRIPRGTYFAAAHAPEPPVFGRRGGGSDRRENVLDGYGPDARGRQQRPSTSTRAPFARDPDRAGNRASAEHGGRPAQPWPGPPTRSPSADDRADRSSRRVWTNADLQPPAGDRYARPRAREERPDTPGRSKAQEQWQTRGLPPSEWRTESASPGEPGAWGGSRRRWSTSDRSHQPPTPSGSAVPRIPIVVEPPLVTPAPALPSRRQERAADHPIYQPRGPFGPRGSAGDSPLMGDRVWQRENGMRRSLPSDVGNPPPRQERFGQDAVRHSPGRESGGQAAPRAVPRHESRGDGESGGRGHRGR